MGAADVIGSPWGLVFCSGSMVEIGSPWGFVFTSASRGFLIVASSAVRLVVALYLVRHLPFRRHVNTCRRRARGEEPQRIDMRFISIDATLKTGIPDGSPVRRQRDAKLLTDPFGDLGD